VKLAKSLRSSLGRDPELHGAITVREFLLEFRDSAILVIARHSNRRQIDPMLMIQEQQVGVVVHNAIELIDVAPIEIPLAAANARPRGLVDVHARIHLFRYDISELTGVLKGVLRSTQKLDVIETYGPAVDLPIRNQRKLLNVSQLC